MLGIPADCQIMAKSRRNVIKTRIKRISIRIGIKSCKQFSMHVACSNFLIYKIFISFRFQEKMSGMLRREYAVNEPS